MLELLYSGRCHHIAHELAISCCNNVNRVHVLYSKIYNTRVNLSHRDASWIQYNLSIKNRTSWTISLDWIQILKKLREFCKKYMHASKVIHKNVLEIILGQFNLLHNFTIGLYCFLNSFSFFILPLFLFASERHKNHHFRIVCW